MAADALHAYCIGSVVHQVRHSDEDGEEALDAAAWAARFRFGLRSLLRGLAP